MTTNKQNLKICYISQEFPPYGGGIATYVDVTSKYITNLGVTTVIITRKDSNKINPQDSRQIEYVGYDTTNPITNFMFRVLRKLRVAKAIDYILIQILFFTRFVILNKKYRFDVIEGPDYLADGILINLFKRFFKNKPTFLIRLHSSNTIVSEYFFHIKDLFHYLSIFFEKMNFKLADRLAGPSDTLITIMKKYTNKQIDKVDYIIDHQDIGPIKKIKIPSQNHIAFPSKVHAGKGVIILVKAMLEILNTNPKHASTKLILMGPEWPNEMIGHSIRKDLDTMIGTKWANNFIFTGNISRKEVLNYVSTSKFVVLPSTYDNYPYAALESIALGKAIIGSSNTGISEIIEKYKCGLIFKNGDISDLAKSITQLLDDPHLNGKLSNAGYENLHTQADDQKNTNKYFKYLLSLAHE